jgi:lipopolysaccharide heptosyltransferase II
MNGSWASATNLLAVRLDGMGDVLMSTPALRALREARPGRRLTLLASPAGAALAQGMPFVDELIEFRAPWMKGPSPACGDECLALVDTLRVRAFDAAIVMTVCTQSALPAATLAMLAGIPRRLAYARENPYALLTDWLPDPDRDVRAGVRHEVRRQLDLVAHAGAVAIDDRLCYQVHADARASMLAKALAAGAHPGRRWIVVHPGATAPSRRYPIRAFADVAATLGSDASWQLVIAGGEDERSAIDRLRCAAPAAVVLPAGLSVGELAALLERAAVVLCNNSGPAHLAAAVGTPVVDLYALTNPQHTPWGVPHLTMSHPVPCHGCLKSVCPEGHHRCLEGVAPRDVVAAVRLLARVPDEARAA